VFALSVALIVATLGARPRGQGLAALDHPDRVNIQASESATPAFPAAAPIREQAMPPSAHGTPAWRIRDGWMFDADFRVIQRREPLTSGASSSVATIQCGTLSAKTRFSADGGNSLPWRQERHRDQHHKGTAAGKKYMAG